MHFSIFFLAFLVVIVLYRQLLKMDKVQLFLHRTKFAWAFQWYTLYIVGVICYMAFSLFELYSNPGYDRIEKDVIETKLREWFSQDMKKGRNSTTSWQKFQEPLNMPEWLRYTNLISQAAGIPVCIIASYHVAKLLVIPGKKLAEKDESYRNFPWKPPPRLNWLLLVVSMPTMFSVMSMRATCRLWALFTGTADVIEPTQFSTEGIKDVYSALQALDLELAALFQFSTVYAFTRICGSLLTEAAFFHQDEERDSGKLAREYSHTIRIAGFLCVWSFVVVGIVRCLLNVAFAEVQWAIALKTATNQVQEHRLFIWQQIVKTLHDNFQDSISLVFSALTVLCVVNMFVICSMSVIKQRLGNANLKFTGTRLLILALEVQGKLIDAFTRGSTLYVTAQEFKEKLPVWVPLKEWYFFKEQAHLFNLSILNIECLIVVVLNVHTWRTLNLEESGIMRFSKKCEEREQNQKMGPVAMRLLEIENSDDEPEPT